MPRETPPWVGSDFEPPTYKLKKIDEQSPEYKASLEITRSANPVVAVFGLSVLEDVELYRRNIGVDYSKTAAEQKIKKVLAASREEFKRLCYSNKTNHATAAFLREAMHDPHLEPQFRKIGSYLFPELAFQFVHRISYKLYEELLRWRQENMRQKQEAFARELPAVQEAVFLRIQRGMDKGTLPIDQRVFERRIKGTQVFLVDGLEMELEGGYGGAFYNEQGAICIGENVPFSAREKTLTHEWLHAFSGNTLASRIFEEGSEQAYTMVSPLRLGMHFKDRERYQSSSRFWWLNEAMTESLVMKLYEDEPTGQKPEFSYVDERALLEAFMVRGKKEIPWNILVNAYFENYNPTLLDTSTQNTRGTGVPAWKKLTTFVSEAYHPRFLVTLDNVVKQHGAKKALAIMQRNKGRT